MNSDPIKEIESPSGIDLEPDPPTAVRLSKRAGILAMVVVAVVVAMIGYGVITRKQRAISMVKLDDSKSLTAATEAGKAVSSKVPERSLIEKREKAEPETAEGDDEELQPPTPRSGNMIPSRPASTTYTPPPAPTYREPTPEEKRRALLAQQQVEALSAPTATGRGSMSSGPAMPVPQTDMTQLTALLQALQGPKAAEAPNAGNVLARLAAHAGVGGDEGEGYREQNMQDDKEAFLDRTRAGAGENYLRSSRTPPLGPYEIKAGWDIPAVLEQELNSDLPGEVKALVRENVFDTATGQHLLIPQGSRLIGLYDSRVAYGQDGMMVVWNRIIFPDGSAINLEGMIAQDARGRSGLRDKVDNHYDRLIGFAALTSGFTAAFQLSQSRRGTVLGYPSAGEVAGSAVGRELSQLGAQITRRNLNVQPTIKVPVGYRFNVRVNRDIVLGTDYPSN